MRQWSHGIPAKRLEASRPQASTRIVKDLSAFLVFFIILSLVRGVLGLFLESSAR